MERLMQQLLNFKSILLAGILFSTAAASAQNRFLSVIRPDVVGIQYAGSIGYLSLSAGYNLLEEKTNLNFNYGYVPESQGGELHIAAVKFEYKPFSIRIKDNFILHPINPSVFVSYTFGKNLDFNFDREQYVKGYYFWSEAVREHLGFSTELKLINLERRNKLARSISFYGEVNTNDLYLISWFENRTSIPFQEIFKVGYGVRMYF